MRWPVLRAALGMPVMAETPAGWQPTLVAARVVDLEIPRAALRWSANHYATPTAKLDDLRAERVLAVPELELLAKVEGTSTVRTAIAAGPLETAHAARLIWALVSLGAIDLTPEVRDVATPQRRALAEIRAHLRARAKRLAGSTFYDVLELTPLAEYPDIENANRMVGQRFAPASLAAHDLAEVAALVEPAWALVEKARSVLVDHAARGRYHDWLRGHAHELSTAWAIEPAAVKAATEAFARGQRALGEGDVHKAMSELATACRHHSGHPDYEANLAWARYRVQVASGRDPIEAARAERKTIEEELLGRRVWPRALVALALLCVAVGDVESARWHLRSALATDPSLPAARQLAQRLA
jgi:hypothetical protein